MWCDVKLLDLILPVRCVVCGAGGEQLCPACRGALPRLAAPLCARCGAPTAWPVAAVPRVRRPPPRIRLGPRGGRVRPGGPAARARLEGARPADARGRGGRRGRRRPAAARRGSARVRPVRPRARPRARAPPGRAARARARRAVVAAGAGAARQDAPRLAAARAVTRRPPAQRRRCVRPCRAKSPPRVALVDDVYTSGSTANAAASALRKGGARRVEVITFARVVR